MDEAADSATDVLPEGGFRVERRVRFAMCDPAGIMYFPGYFDLFNALVEDWLESLGWGWASTIPAKGFTTPIVHASADYLRPSRLGDRLELGVVIRRIGRRSLDLAIPVLSDGELRVRGRLVHVAISLSSFEAIDWPADLRAALEAYRARCG